MSEKILPLGDLVLLQIIEVEKTSGGIIIPEKSRSNTMRDAQLGRVLAIGPGRTTEQGAFLQVHVKPGDLVLVPRNMGVEVVHEQATLRMLRDSELLGTLELSQIITMEPPTASGLVLP